MAYSTIVGEKQIVCPRCGHNESYIRIANDDGSEFGECKSCGKLTYLNLKNTSGSDKQPTIKCPYCGSTNTKKISTASKVGSVALFGIFAAGKVSKEWHCNNCKSDF